LFTTRIYSNESKFCLYHTAENNTLYILRDYIINDTELSFTYPNLTSLRLSLTTPFIRIEKDISEKEIINILNGNYKNDESIGCEDAERLLRKINIKQGGG